MIFVTVGTHEQPFDRLLQAVDRLKGSDIIQEPVVIQTGYSHYQPKYSDYYKLLPYTKMQQYIADARIVITHGGPASFLMSLQMGKIPIVVPRQLAFKEHVNNHQVDFTKAVEERMGNIIPVYDIADLEDRIINYDKLVAGLSGKGSDSNNTIFNQRLNDMVDDLFNLQGK